MSGYGGNLTFPDNKQFRNSIGLLASPGAAGQELRLIEDKKVQGGVAGNKTLFIESTGDYIPGGSNATVTRVDHKASVARQIQVILSDNAGCDDCNAELGFTIKAVAEHPGVMNDNLFGQRRAYYFSFNPTDPVTSGKYSDLDMMTAYANICQQITDDSGRYNQNQQGNVESVVDAVVEINFSADVGTAGTFDIPAAGLYGKTLAQVQDYVDATVAAATKITNTGGTVTIPGYGFIVHPAGAETITDHKFILTTKSEYQDKTTFVVEKATGVFTITTPGNFELLPWEEVYREFSHMPHNAPLSQHQYSEMPEKPDSTHVWAKFILETGHSNASFHGASHGESYKERMVLFIKDTAANLDSVMKADGSAGLLKDWAS